MQKEISEEEQFKEFKRANRIKEAKASVLKIECDALSPQLDKSSLKAVCQKATATQVGGVVVLPGYVKQCVAYLGSNPSVSLVAAVGYPHGADVTAVKVLAVKQAVKDGVDEVEVCAPLFAIKDGNFQYLKRECKKLKKAAKVRALRVVLDCTQLTEKELLKACIVCADCAVNCIRLNGVDAQIVAKVKGALKGRCLIKASSAKEPSTFATYCNVGADVVDCINAFQLAEYIINDAAAQE